MDLYDNETLNKNVNSFKNIIKSKLDNYSFSTRELKNHVDSICIAWDYSPKLNDERKHFETYTINKDQFTFKNKDDIHQKSNSNDNSKKDNSDKDNTDSALNTIKENISKSSNIVECIISPNNTGCSGKKNSKIQKLNSKINDSSNLKSSLKNITIKSNTNSKINAHENAINFKAKSKSNKEDNQNIISNEKKSVNKNIKDNSNSIVKTDINNNNNNNYDTSNDESEDSEEYFERIRRMREEKNNKENASESSQNNLTNFNSFIYDQKKTRKHRLTENKTMRFYLFNTQEYIDFQVYFGETIKDIKEKILNVLFNESLDLNDYHSKVYNNIVSKLNYKQDVNAYEIRLSDEDEDVVPNMDFAPLEDRLNLLSCKWQTLCIIEKKNYNQFDSTSSQVALGLQEGNKIFIKIYNKTDPYNISYSNSTIIKDNPENTIKNVINRLEKKQFLSNYNYKLTSYYFVCEHSSKAFKDSDFDDLEDENELMLDMQLKYLTFFEIDIYLRKYTDAPDYSKSVPNNQFFKEYKTFKNIKKPGMTMGNNKLSALKNNNDNINIEKIEKDYVFNDFSASQFKEYEVIKINKYNTRQERLLGIDRYHIYNNLPKNKDKNFISGLFGSGTKNPLRKTTDIKKCDVLSEKMFYLEMEKNNKTKKITYEVKDINTRNEIIAKIRYIMVRF